MAAGVTFSVANHSAQAVGISSDYGQFFVLGLPEYRQEGCGQILQGTPVTPLSFQPSDNSFVHGVVHAYSKHHNIVIRPDDVWLAILIQFAFYVNGNADALKSVFVTHHGKKMLTVKQVANLKSADYGLLARDMVAQLQHNLKDNSFSDWVLPCFSTTTNNDLVIASVALMGTMKQYFDYKFQLCCGIPQVTLAGTTKDWEEVHARVEKLEHGVYGEICKSWAVMLKKITMQFIKTSRKDIDLDFWSRICHYTSGGSGPSYLSGWITAFCVFDGKGKWQGNNFNLPQDRWYDATEPMDPPVLLEFPVIDSSDIPPGYITVDVTVDDNGVEHKTLMFAGHMGYEVVQQGMGIAPKPTWALALKSQDKVASNELWLERDNFLE